VRSERGSALVLVLLAAAVVVGIASLVAALSNRDMQHAYADLRLVRAVSMAQGGVRLAKSVLAVGMRGTLEGSATTNANFNAEWFFGETSTDDPNQPDPTSVATALAAVVGDMQSKADEVFCGRDFDDSDGELSIRVHFTQTACSSKNLPGGMQLGTPHYVSGPKGPGNAVVQTYAIPFVVVVKAETSGATRQYVSAGELRFSLGSPSFARYALFTNRHQTRSGKTVWFTSQTLFDGPVHTNEHFAFYRRPWFGGEVTSAGCSHAGTQECNGTVWYGAYFHRYPYARAVRDTEMTPDPTAPSIRTNTGTHAPQFTAGVDWRSEFIPMPENLNEQKAKALEAGIYSASGIVSLEFEIDPGPPKYQIIKVTECGGTAWNGTCYGGVRPTVTYRYAANGLLERYNPNTEAWEQLVRNGKPVVFNGVIYSDKQILEVRGPERDGENIPPAIASFAKIGVYSQYDIWIESDLTYEDPPCSSYPERNDDGSVTPAVCENLNAENVLGIYSQQGSVYIGRDAPDNVVIHAALMSAWGQITVEDYDSPGYRGTAHVLGGLVQYYYGAFGTFGGFYGDTGYSRKIVYDPRFSQGIAPPYYPTAQTAKVIAVSTITYGTREQLY